MSTFNWFKLTVLAAIWGSSFIFMKILVPVIGVLPTACLRILISGLVLTSGMKLLRMNLEFKKHFRHYFTVGVLNAALPFFLYSFAALHAPSSLSVIMNSTTPIFGAVFALMWLEERMNWKKGAGFFLGTSGVTLIALKSSHGQASGAHEFSMMTLLSAFAGLTAAACYALSGIYMKRFAPNVRSYSMAGLSHLLGGLILAPFALMEWSGHPSSPALYDSKTWAALLGLSLLCSAIGFLIFYHLFDRVGPTQTLMVGYLIPAFGILWGALFLGETIHTEMVAGTVMILGAVALISAKKSVPTPKTLSKQHLDKLIQNELVADAESSASSGALVS
ncbi:MAG: DMT family transporter [Bdellovibrionales bacterium]|nr:DMT family transporter [Bdellovibrionales bacterium]